MNCPNCATPNPDEAAFCMKCGTAMPAGCGNCGAELPADAAFCMKCGHKVDSAGASTVAPSVSSTAASGPPTAEVDDRIRRYMPAELAAKLEEAAAQGEMRGERRTVTMLFCDIKGSTTAAETLDPEEWADIMNQAFEHLIAPVYRYEGTVARLLGDAILAFFGAPIAHEDDPERAVLAGLEIIEAIQPYKERVKRDWGIDFDVRVGINTGLVVVGAVGSDLRVEYTVMGDAVNVAARMEQTATPGTVHISGETQQFVAPLFEMEDLGAIDIKGRSEPVDAYRVIQPLERPATLRGIDGLRAPLIARDGELASLGEAFAETAAGRGCVVSVMGEAGLGKSRLISELREALTADGSLHGVAWHQGSSLSYETATPYAPICRILRSLAGLKEDETDERIWEAVDALVRRVAPGRVFEIAPFVAALLDAELHEEHVNRIAYLQPAQLRAESFRAVRELLAAVAEDQPLVLVFEDLHWADSVSIGLLIELLALADHANLLMLLLFRPRRQEVSWKVHEAAERDHPHRYRSLTLTPLERDDTREMVSQLLSVDGLTDSVRDLILAKSDGNPFFVEEVIRSMIDEGLVVKEGERWVAPHRVTDFPVPLTLSALLTSRLDRLGDDARIVAQAASVIGPEFHFDELAALLGDVHSIEDGLLDLQRRELVREVSRVPKRVFEFKHALVVDSTYETVLLKRRRELHASLANFLERLHPERSGTIADHLLKARQRLQAAPFLVAAAEKAARAFAIPEAIERAETAIEILGEDGDLDLLLRALETLGKAREFSFDLEGAASAYERLRALGEAKQHGPMYISGLNKKALLKGFFFDQHDEALADLKQAEALAKNQDHGEGVIESSMFQCFLRTAHAEFDEVASYMEQVTDLGEELDHEEATLFGMTHLANTLMLLTRFDEALDHGKLALATAEEKGNLKYQAELLTLVIPMCHVRNGDTDKASTAIERGMEIALQIGDRQSEAFAAVMQGGIALRQGSLETALSLFRRAMAAADAMGMPSMRALGLCVTGTACQQIGGDFLRQAQEYHDQALQVMEMPTGRNLGGWLWAEIGLCALESGRIEDAKGLFDRALTEATSPMHIMRPMALRGSALVAVAEDRIEDAQRIHTELEKYVRTRQMRDQEPYLPFTAAMIDSASGDYKAAIGHLAQAEAAMTEAGMRRTLLDVKAAQANAFAALELREDAERVRAAGMQLVDDIAGAISDPEIRRCFISDAATLLGAAVA